MEVVAESLGCFFEDVLDWITIGRSSVCSEHNSIQLILGRLLFRLLTTKGCLVIGNGFIPGGNDSVRPTIYAPGLFKLGETSIYGVLGKSCGILFTVQPAQASQGTFLHQLG